MPALLIVDTKINDPDAYEEYKALAKPLAEQAGGVYRARGERMEVVEDALWSPTRIVVIEFPTFEAAKAFITSDAYAPVKKLRHSYAESTAVIVEIS